MDGVITRFAPSPTGYLHLGHAYSAWCAFDFAQRHGGRFLLRIEDIDTVRCRPEYTEAIFADLAWLGFYWPEPVRQQSQHMVTYGDALVQLQDLGLLYPCFCTRKSIQQEIANANRAPHGPDGPLYPGRCRALSMAERMERLHEGQSHALRLDVGRALELLGGVPLHWVDGEQGVEITATPEIFGDVVLARKESPTSYHLAVTLDDHVQGISHVVRGEDLRQATHLHRLLQALLGLRTPIYHHHPLLTDEQGKRYAKRDKSLTLRALRAEGVSAEAIMQRVRSGATLLA
ncbi:glutamyl-tRNA synthetase, class Ic [Magnetococcus marinus MC-1]|uniref:Glutamyl-tRNA synthetase, class Ic n=1 Tax=Magnetococcus marinus (strain ATCC BAA-1437 / JCM 17883 / MC-1) TaxID=156889 RepID=A0LDU4_MAGMM|nr:tRNA glutamyl-Q(34) synthetase GluQRS [Magnetococcus marinus]ABK46137.1 glutamyl-tRNA synthetase, class Ic [Magnetococcus marinus MC-1]